MSSPRKSSIALYGTAPTSLAKLDWFEFTTESRRYAIFTSDIGRGHGTLMKVDGHSVSIAAIHPITASDDGQRDAIRDSARIRQIISRAMKEEPALKELLTLLGNRGTA